MGLPSSSQLLPFSSGIHHIHHIHQIHHSKNNNEIERVRKEEWSQNTDLLLAYVDVVDGDGFPGPIGEALLADRFIVLLSDCGG